MVAVAAPAAILAALFALLFLLAWQQWRSVILNSINISLPIVGRVIADAVGYVLDGAYQLIVYWFDSLLHPLAEFILRPIAAVENGFSALYSASLNAYIAVQGIITTRIPAAISSAAGYANQIVSASVNSLDVTISNVRSALNASIVDVRNYATSILSAAVSYTDQVVSASMNALDVTISDVRSVLNAAIAAEHQFAANIYTTATAFTVTAYDDATAYARSLAAAGATDLSTAVDQLESYAQTTATAAVGVLSTDIDQAISAAWGTISTDVDAAVQGTIGIITVGDDDILAALRALAKVNPLDIAGVASLVGITTLTLTRYLRDCGIPNCQNLGQLGKDLQALLGLVEDASFLAFLVELVEHPSGAAGLVESTFGGAIADTVGAFRSLVGV